MAKAGGLPWDVILGSDVSRAYKPAMEAYLRPAAMLGLEPGEIMRAAAHEADLEAARQAGLAAAFISRPLERGPAIPGAGGVATKPWGPVRIVHHRTRRSLVIHAGGADPAVLRDTP
jgi:FMN phosphatase YigB (HAD superfamily)